MSNGHPYSLEPLDRRQHFVAGFVASYFPTTTFTGKSVTRADAQIAFNWKNTAPAEGVSPRAFSARWTGQLNPTTTGRHAVYVSSEGAVRVWINHQLVLNKPAAPGVVAHYKIPVVLTAHQPADIQIEYRHLAGRGYIAAAYVEPGGNKVVLTGDDVSARAVSLNDQIDHARIFAADQTVENYRTLLPKNGFPSRSEPRSPNWLLTPATDWTSGTFAGVMWELSKTFAGWDKPATEWTLALGTSPQIAGDAFAREWAAFKPLLDSPDVNNHGVATNVLITSASRKYRLYDAGPHAFKTPEIVSHSGNANATFGVLMDQSMDMEELLWAAQRTGETLFRTFVISHMKTVAKYMVRADGSVFQRAFFNGWTGAFVSGENSQGYSDATTWSRAQAWAMDSFATVSETDNSFLPTARKVADYFISRTPADGVPYWDFQSPNIPRTYRDSSAAAIAAGALVKLSDLTTGAERAKYKAAAERILTSLTSPTYLAEGTTLKGILQHGAAHVPRNKGVDAALMFGDYYFLRAMNGYTASLA